jgi:hypothetical protein
VVPVHEGNICEITPCFARLATRFASSHSISGMN